MTPRFAAALALALCAPLALPAPAVAQDAAMPADGQEIWQLDRLRIQNAPGQPALDVLRDDHSMAAVMAHLDKVGIKYSRAMVAVPMSTLPSRLVAVVRVMAKGEPFVMMVDGAPTVNVLTGITQAAFAASPPPWTPPVSAAPGAAQLAAARHFLDAAMPPATREQFFDRMVDVTMGNLVTGMLRQQRLDTMLKTHPALRAIFARFVARQRDLALADLHANLAGLIDAQTAAYARLFSVDELNQLARFFGQPLGRKYLVQSQLLVTQPEMAAWQQGVAARAQTRIPGEIQQLMQQIQAALAKEKTDHVS